MGDDGELERIEAEERALSRRRRRLHDRIDFARQSEGSGTAAVDLDAMLEEERALSDERAALHRKIDELRARLGKEPGRPPRKRLTD